jgi:hypothetical protein
MQFFPLADLQHWVLAIFIGLIFLILVYLAFGSHARTRVRSLTEEPEKGKEHDLFLGHEEEKNPIAPLLIFIYVGVILFAVGYLVVIGIRGSAF